MADISKQLAQTYEMIEKGKYFIINRPRQYGKTTTLYSMANRLNESGKYLVFNISFEGIGDDIFNDEKVFSKGLNEVVFNSKDTHLQKESFGSVSSGILIVCLQTANGLAEQKIVFSR